MVVWAAVSLAVILLWPTKWPQYTLIVIPPLCLSLGYGAVDVARAANERFQLDYYLAPFRIPRLTLILAALAGLAVAVVLSLEGFLYWQGNLGWQQINMHNSGLHSDAVQAVAVDERDRLWVGTRSGLAMRNGETWALFGAETSDLPGDSVQALAIAGDRVWAGSDRGLAVFDGRRWQRVGANGGGAPPGSDVRGLAVAPDGVLWVATTRGLGAFDGSAWRWFVTANSGLPSDLVFAVALGSDGRVWAGTDQGVGVFDPRTQSWQHFDRTNSSLEWNAVSSIAVTQEGHVWLGTLGGGVTIFDGAGWRTMMTANSALPWNTIVAVAACPAGDIWVAADLPTTAGGNVARWGGATWTTLTTQRSGIAGGAASSFACDGRGDVVIGMRTAGVSIYTARRGK